MSSSGNYPLTFRLQVIGDAEVQAKFNKLGQSMKQLQPSANQANNAVKQTQTTFTSAGKAAETSSSGVTNYGGALVGLGSKTTQARTSTDAFSGSLTSLSKSNQMATGSLSEANTVTQGLVPSMDKMGNSATKTQGKMDKLRQGFQGNKGLIFSVTMLSSGMTEAIGMYQSYGDASDKLADAKEKLANMEAKGLENTKEYAQAAKEASDAQRGFNFIQRFTIQSFSDMIPMSLMLTSSLFDQSGTLGGLSGMKTKLAGATTKLTGAITTMGSAMTQFTMRHPYLLLLAALAAAAVALITNVGGVRDRVNELGVALGNMLGPAKPILEWFGSVMNQAADGANSFLNFGQTATASLTDVQEQAVETGDATTLLYNDQINLMAELGEEAETMYFSLGAFMQERVNDEKKHKEQYAKYVEALQSGDDVLIQSMGLTGEEEKKLYDEWKADIKEFETAFGASVEKIAQNFSDFRDDTTTATDDFIGEIQKIENEILLLTQQSWDMEDEELEETEAKIVDLTGKLEGLKGKISDTALAAGIDFKTLQETGTEALKLFALEVQGGDFDSAIATLETAIDSVPPKYQGNFSEIEKILGNAELTNKQKVQAIVTHYDDLKESFGSLQQGAYQYNMEQAKLVSGFDEMAIAARGNSANVKEMDSAWQLFVDGLPEESKQLPIIKDLIEQVAAGHITAEEAMRQVEAAGKDMSTILGDSVAVSWEELKKTVIDMPGPMTAVFATINGEVEKVGEIHDTQLVSGPESVVNSMVKTEDEAKNLSTVASTETGKQKLSIADLAKQGKVQFLNFNNAMGTSGTAMTNMTTTTQTEVPKWSKSIEDFKTDALAWLGEVQKTLNTLWQSAQERLSNTNFSNLLPGVQNVEGSSEGDGKGLSNLDEVHNHPLMGGTGTTTTKGGVPGGMTEQQVTALHKAWSSFSTSMSTYSKSITASITAIQTAASTLSTSMATYATSMKTNFGAFGTAFVGVVDAIIPIITLLQGTFSTLSISVMTYATSMTTNTSNWVITSITSMGELVKVILVTQGVYSTFSTSVATYMISMMTNTTNWGIATITTFSEVSKNVLVTQGVYSTFSTSVATYMISMMTNTANWGVASITAMSNVSKNALVTQGTLSTMSTSVATYMKSMTTNIGNFASSAVSDLKAVTSAANSATSAFNKMAQAAAKAASAAAKARSAGGAGQYGGMFLTAQSGGLFMQGGGFVIYHRQKIGGVTVGEWNKPEAIQYDQRSGVMSVTPLTDPSKLYDRGGGGGGGQIGSGSGSAGGLNQPINITLINHIDGNEIINDMKLTKKIKLENGKNLSRFI